MRTIHFVVGAVLSAAFAGGALAQDPAKVDPKHYKVEFENDQVRVLRATYGPGEKSVMHEHPATVAVFVSEAHIKFTTGEGKAQDTDVKAGTTRFNAPGKHLPENIGNKPLEVIVIELKAKPATSK